MKGIAGRDTYQGNRQIYPTVHEKKRQVQAFLLGNDHGRLLCLIDADVERCNL